MSGARPVRRAAWTAIALVALVSLAVGATGDPGPETAAERVQRIAATIKCPECIGQSVADSDSSRARAIIAEIGRGVDRGDTDDQIVQGILDRYGDQVNLTPPGTGFAALVWVLPVLALVLGLAGLAAAFWRWRNLPVRRASDDDRRLVEQARRGR